MSIKNTILIRLRIVFFAVCLFGIAIIVQSTRIQMVHGEYYRSKADSTHIRYRSIEAERGNIYATGGELLAASIPFFSVAMDPGAPSSSDFIENIDSLSFCLSKELGDRSASDYKRMLISARESGRRYVVLDRKVSFPELQRIKSFPILRRGQYKGGLVIETFNRRSNPYGVLAHRTIGYVNAGTGVGLEGFFNEELGGQNGKRLMRKLSSDDWLPLNDKNEIEPIDGYDLISTLDIGIQDVAENALEQTLIKNNAAYGSVIVMEVETGAIRAMANLTRIGSSEENSARYTEQFNYAVGDRTDPGSTFKLASVLALLEDKHCDLNTQVDLNSGRWSYHGHAMRDSDDGHGLREVPLMRAFWRSSNVGISKLVQKHYGREKENFAKRLKQFHLNEPTGITIKGEVNPYVKTDPSDGNEWTGITLPWMSVGYEMQISPLQMLNFYNTVANDGKMMRPYLVSELKKHGELIKKYEPEVMDESIASKKAIEQVQFLLETVVDSGTARSLRSPHYRFAGKTGTAQIANERLRYSDKVYQSSFAGYFPADNPKYSCMIVVSAPSNGRYYGADVAGPVFRAIADRVCSSNLEMHSPLNEGLQEENSKLGPGKGYAPDLKLVCNELNVSIETAIESEWAITESNEEGTTLRALKLENHKLPNVKGMGLRDAIFLLENKGWNVSVNGIGKVKSIRRDGETVYLELG